MLNYLWFWSQDEQNTTKHKVHSYAVRFLKDSRSLGISSQAEAPATPDKVLDLGIVNMSWDDHLTEVWAKSPYPYLISLLVCMLVTFLLCILTFCQIKILLLKSMECCHFNIV